MANRHGPGYWDRHLEAWYRSELTQREYCAKHGLQERWRFKQRRLLAATAL